MNNNLLQTEALLQELKMQVIPENVTVMVAPAYTNLYHAFESVRGQAIEVVAQNMHQSKNGAYTGEVSAEMLKSVGIDTVILGHSERRAYFNDTNAVLAEKVNTALENDMQAIFCFGEELEDRKQGEQFEVVKAQLEQGLLHLNEEQFKNIIHAYVRKLIASAYSDTVAENVSILYGGSVKPGNAKEIFANPDVDGGLIGGAALNANDFMAIVNAF
jgi:triosephosphate isomerase